MLTRKKPGPATRRTREERRVGGWAVGVVGGNTQSQVRTLPTAIGRCTPGPATLAPRRISLRVWMSARGKLIHGRGRLRVSAVHESGEKEVLAHELQNAGELAETMPVCRECVLQFADGGDEHGALKAELGAGVGGEGHREPPQPGHETSFNGLPHAMPSTSCPQRSSRAMSTVHWCPAEHSNRCR